jgi:hypothetical protein
LFRKNTTLLVFAFNLLTVYYMIYKKSIRNN